MTGNAMKKPAENLRKFFTTAILCALRCLYFPCMCVCVCVRGAEEKGLNQCCGTNCVL